MERNIQKSSTNGYMLLTEGDRLQATVIEFFTKQLATYVTSAISTNTYSRGFLRSVLWEKSCVEKGEKLSSIILHVMLVPYSDGVAYRNGCKMCYKLLVYSYLSQDTTRRVRARLMESILNIGISDYEFFWKTPQGFERL